MKKKWLLTAAVCAAVLLAAALMTGYGIDTTRKHVLRVGFVFSEDESTPYTANFVQAARRLEEEYGIRLIEVDEDVLG